MNTVSAGIVANFGSSGRRTAMSIRDFASNHFQGTLDLERLAQSDPTLWALHISEVQLGPSVLELPAALRTNSTLTHLCLSWGSVVHWVVNNQFEISNLEIQFRRPAKSLTLAGSSLLYQRRCLQPNTHFSAFFEIYKICNPSHR